MRDEVSFHTGGCMDFKKLLLVLLLLANICYADEIDVNAYMEQYSKEVQQIIKANFKYNGEESATASVSYRINPDGSVEDIKVEKSGGADMDEVLINAVKKSAPFKPFPEDLNLSSVRMTTGFQHVVHKYQSPNYQNARMAILPVQPSAETQKAHQEYMDKLNKYIFDRIPTTYNHIPNEPSVRCKVTKYGTLKDIKITQSSGLEEYDRKLIETFSKIQYKPFPAELNQYEELPFSMKVYKQIRTNRGFDNPYYRMW